MAKTRINYIEGASKRYPQWNEKWDETNGDMMECFRAFHRDLRAKGYNVRCANVAEKDGAVYWILVTGSGNYSLEHFGYLK